MLRFLLIYSHANQPGPYSQWSELCFYTRLEIISVRVSEKASSGRFRHHIELGGDVCFLKFVTELYTAQDICRVLRYEEGVGSKSQIPRYVICERSLR
jgi:hypothetical protein